VLGVFVADCDFFVWGDFDAVCVFFYEALAVFLFEVVHELVVVDVFCDFGWVFDSGFFLYFSF